MATGSRPTPQTRSTIRRAAPGDLTRLVGLLDHYYTEWSVLQRDSPERVLDALRAPEPFGFLVAEHGGELAGCVLLRALASIPSAAECKRLYVLPEHRGRGLASQLMDCAEQLAASSHLSWVYLDTGVGFTAALSLYEGRGYEPCERYNDNPQAAFFFRKQIGI